MCVYFSIPEITKALIVSQSDEIGVYSTPAVVRRGKQIIFSFGTAAADQLGLIRVRNSQ
jgi:hypothetical protein